MSWCSPVRWLRRQRVSLQLRLFWRKSTGGRSLSAPKGSWSYGKACNPRRLEARSPNGHPTWMKTPMAMTTTHHLNWSAPCRCSSPSAPSRPSKPPAHLVTTGATETATGHTSSTLPISSLGGTSSTTWAIISTRCCRRKRREWGALSGTLPSMMTSSRWTNLPSKWLRMKLSRQRRRRRWASCSRRTFWMNPARLLSPRPPKSRSSMGLRTSAWCRFRRRQ
mmetsp:Transcript_19932/g.60479  ORF Transcript_19932/g.60479 Transcript_19932/m.60479 type:complete len:222 (+) Transcript_19932:1696-2361(+)